MLTSIGSGNRSLIHFSADFSGGQIYIGGQQFPAGFFANEALNISKTDMTDLLITAGALLHASQSLSVNNFDDKAFFTAKSAVLSIHERVSPWMPFCLLDMKAARNALSTIFSEDARLSMHDYWKLIQEQDAAGNILSAKLSDTENLRADIEGRLFNDFMEALRFYLYIPMDLSNFGIAILNLEQDHLSKLSKRDAHHYATSCDTFFSDPEIPLKLYLAQVTQAVAGFSLRANTQQEFVVLSDPAENGKQLIGRRLYFHRLMDFLVTDFFEGLHAGHAPRRCAACGRFFLTTDARPRKYCSGYAPTDPRGRFCQAVGARRKRADRERAKNHPVKVICEKRCNTIGHHLRQGKIDTAFAEKAKVLARQRRDKALRDHAYFLHDYESEMTQDAIYQAVEKALGRPPEKEHAYE